MSQRVHYIQLFKLSTDLNDFLLFILEYSVPKS